MRQGLGGLVLALALAGCWRFALAEDASEVIEPDLAPAAPIEPSATPSEAKPAVQQSLDKRTQTIDEPGFKATVTYPEQPVPKFDQNTRPDEAVKPPKKKTLQLAKEEGVDDAESVADDPVSPVPPGDASANGEDLAREDISPALAKIIEKEQHTKKHSDVVTLYHEFLNDDSENAAARYRLGLALVRNGEPTKGVVELERALLLKPANTKYQCDFGLAALQVGWHEKAVVACSAAVKARPLDARYQSAMGDCFLAARRYNDAAGCYSRAITLDKGKTPAYVYNMGMVHLHGRAFKEAVRYFDEAIRMRNDFAPYYCSRGIAQENLKNLKQAAQDYATALKIDKNNAYAHHLLAGMYSDPDDPTYTNRFAAMEHATRAVKLTDSKTPMYLMGLARALRVGRDYDQAVVVAKKAVELDPRDDYKKELNMLQQLRDKGFGQ
jgi:tetratricopeptide (TPR) repeat protein